MIRARSHSANQTKETQQMNRPGTRLAAILLALLAVLAIATSPAGAKAIHHKLGSFNGSEAPEGPFAPGLVSDAVDNSGGPSDGDVYVAQASLFGGESLIDKFEEEEAGKYAGVQIKGASTPAGSATNGEPFGFGFLAGGIAVDSSAGAHKGDLYVADTEHHVIDRFSESGAFECQITGKTPVSITEKTDECNGAAGSATPGGSITPAGLAVNSTNGDIYVADDAHEAIEEFGPSGEWLAQIADPHLSGEMANMALDSAGNLYVARAGNDEGRYVAELDSAGNFVHRFGKTGIDFTEAYGVAVNPATDEVYVFEQGPETPGRISEYDPDGTLLGSIPLSESVSLGLAVDSASGKLYATELSFATFEGSVSVYGPDIGIPTVTPLPATNIAEASATLHGHVDPDAAHGGTDVTACSFEYVEASEYKPSEPNPYAAGKTASCSPAPSYTSPTDVSANVTELNPATTYHYRLVAESALGKSESEDETFSSRGPPAIEAGSENSLVSGVNATLKAKINPFGLDTTCQMQFVSESDFQASEWAKATTKPCLPADVGSAFGYQNAVARLEGLALATTYHYRFLAANPAPGGTATGEDKTFVTFGAENVTFELINEEGEGHPYTQAGGHPYELRTFFGLTWSENPGIEPRPEGVHRYEVPTGNLKTVITELPPGLIGNPAATPKCTRAQVIKYKCSGAAQVGKLSVLQPGDDGLGYQNQALVGLYNLVPPKGVAAELGANILQHVTIYIDAKLRPDGGYALTAESANNTTISGVTEVYLHLWGVPADPSHDGERECPAPNGVGEFGPCSANAPLKPFLSNPTSCGGPLTTTLSFDSYQTPGQFDEHPIEMPPITGCNQLEFSPTLEARPTTNLADSPTGLGVDLHIPQKPMIEDPNGKNEANLKDTKIVLPAGLDVNPAAASGLEACSSSQIGLRSAPGATPIRFSAAPPNCPDAAKLGTVEVDTPLLEAPLPGAAYIAKPYDNPFDSLLAMYIVLDDPQTGIVVKLAGHVEADPQTGQLTATFDENPQAPVEDFKLHLFAGAHATLRTPPTCGAYRTTSVLTPWSAPESGPPATPSDPWQISAAPGGGNCPASAGEEPNALAFEAGTETPVAGAFSPLVLRLHRDDDSQELKGINTTLPPGLTGKLAGIAECPQGALEASEHKTGAEEKASPSCPLTSELGVVNVGVGAGPAPYYAQGHAYLAGPYKGAPLSLAIITPAVAGPFDLGTVLVRVALYVNPETAQITAKSDSIPTILQGIPLDVRSIAVKMDRNRFTLNPTSCERMAVGGEALSALGQDVSLTSPFQVGGCGVLGFKPKLKLTLKGATHRGGHPALRAQLTMPPGDANVARATVTLPRSEFLDQSHIGTICTRVQFAEGSTPGEKCPAASIYGRAKAITPLLDHPLEGPVYLRSSNHKLPDLVIALNGQIQVVLAGRVDSVNGGIRNSFEAVPDAAVSKFVLEMQGGKKGLLVNSTNLCAKTNRAVADSTAHNGKVDDFEPAVKADCGGRHKRRKHGAR